MNKLSVHSNAKLAILDVEMRARYAHYCSTDPDFMKQQGFLVLDNPNILDFCAKIPRKATDKERMINQPDTIYEWKGFHIIAKRSKSKYDPDKYSSSILVTADVIDDLFKLRNKISRKEFIYFVYMYEDKFIVYDMRVILNNFSNDNIRKQYEKFIRCHNPKTDMCDRTRVYTIPYSWGDVNDYTSTTLNLRQQYYENIQTEGHSDNPTFLSNIHEESLTEPLREISPLI